MIEQIAAWIVLYLFAMWGFPCLLYRDEHTCPYLDIVRGWHAVVGVVVVITCVATLVWWAIEVALLK